MANACVLALSKGYTVEQWFMAVSGGKPYCVKFYVSNNNVTQIQSIVFLKPPTSYLTCECLLEGY